MKGSKSARKLHTADTEAALSRNEKRKARLTVSSDEGMGSRSRTSAFAPTNGDNRRQYPRLQIQAELLPPLVSLSSFLESSALLLFRQNEAKPASHRERV